MPKAPFFTEGRMITHSALSTRSFGMSSGIFRISFNTVPASLTRSSSRSSLAAKVAVADIRTTRKHTMDFFIEHCLAIDVASADADNNDSKDDVRATSVQNNRSIGPRNTALSQRTVTNVIPASDHAPLPNCQPQPRQSA